MAIVVRAWQVLVVGAVWALLAAPATAFVLPRAGCSFNTKNGTMPSPEPLILKASGSLDVFGYVDPDLNGDVVLAVGEQIRLACPGTVLTAPAVDEALATCVSGITFSVNGRNYKLADLNCSKHPTHGGFYESASCGEKNRGRVALIVHQTQRGNVSLIEVCFDPIKLEALYAIAVVRSSIGGSETGVDRPSFGSYGFYGSVDPNSHYVRDGQIAAFTQILGSQGKAEEYISRTSDYYLARGHLVAKADFAWAQPQRATFYYINAAPQWQTFNGGNWEKLESSVRKLADVRGLDLVVITGTYGVSTLPDINGNLLGLSIGNNGQIPVPALFWKIIYDSNSKLGAAFVGVNNPYTTLAENKSLVLCDDVCSSITYLSWSPTNVKQGEGYCCTVKDLTDAVPGIPKLDVSGLLR